MCESVCIFMTFTVFYCTFLLILSVCMSLCVCVWAMLPDSNKMMMTMIKHVVTTVCSGRVIIIIIIMFVYWRL